MMEITGSSRRKNWKILRTRYKKFVKSGKLLDELYFIVYYSNSAYEF